jgi:hypothetical protein
MKLGTPVWKLNYLRHTAIPALRDDLKDLAPRGLTPTECNDVQHVFKTIIGQAEASPEDALNRTDVVGALKYLLEKYQAWNSFPSNSEDGKIKRTRAILDVKNARDEVAVVIRENQNAINEVLGHDIINPIFEQLKALTTRYAYFPNLKTAVEKYFRITGRLK